MKLKILLTLVGMSFCACGVKSDPLPPEKPPLLGRGQPTFKRATTDFAYPNLPPLESSDDQDKELEDGEKSY